VAFQAHPDLVSRDMIWWIEGARRFVHT